VNKRRSLCVIPARGGSKTIPLKNIALLNGKPLLHYALSAASKARLIDRVVVSSDHVKIRKIAEEYGDNIVLERPACLASDNTPSRSVILHALDVCERQDGCRYEHIILVQATNPLVTPEDIDNTLEKLTETNCDMCVTVVSLGHLHPSKFKILRDDRLLSFVEEEKELLPRQGLDEIYIRNGSCYAYKREALFESNLEGKDIRAIVVPKERYVDINDQVDLKVAECLLAFSTSK